MAHTLQEALRAAHPDSGFRIRDPHSEDMHRHARVMALRMALRAALLPTTELHILDGCLDVQDSADSTLRNGAYLTDFGAFAGRRPKTLDRACRPARHVRTTIRER